jgi:Zn-dependent peptidase ImmA (M78 family)
MKFKIPTEIDLAGQTFQVVMEPSIQKLAGCCGQTHFDEGIIIINPQLRPDTRNVTYFHELTHAILMTMGAQDLNKDEAFVDTFGNLLWQSFKTAKY